VSNLRYFALPALFFVVPVLVGFVAMALFWISLKRRATRFGYASTGTYLRAVPRSDAERRDAADLAMKGLVFCVLGQLLSPLVLAGLIPLFYGGRKFVYASMGLGLVDDADQPEA
jgi:hypothetical protein